jgi:hypothetical protein
MQCVTMLNVDMQSLYFECHHAECRYAECGYAQFHCVECRHAKCIKHSVTMLNVVILVIMQNMDNTVSLC